LEVSPELRDRQKTLLGSFIKDYPYPNSIEWVSEIPDQFDGVVLANEVLDAIPVDLVIKQNAH
jgi:SAM-dependent MidA family methyltransferase